MVAKEKLLTDQINKTFEKTPDVHKSSKAFSVYNFARIFRGPMTISKMILFSQPQIELNLNLTFAKDLV